SCIRDRHEAVNEKKIIYVENVFEDSRAEGERDLAKLKVIFCLFYTSDAADDLRCVALGRILIITQQNLLNKQIKHRN
ncbi:hypothetical protein BGV20_20050, partial [Clostridioides difficile]|uniref:hypothetical protein n=1 Tax=Clostridioides difficile TaxID=1496 RepID=UPI000BD2A290